MGNTLGFFQTVRAEESPEQKEATRKYLQLLETEQHMEQVTRFRWKLEESRTGMPLEFFTEHQEILDYLTENNSDIRQLISLAKSNLPQPEVDQLVEHITAVQRNIYQQMFFEGFEANLLPVIELLITNIEIIRQHLIENIINYPQNRLSEIEHIKKSFRKIVEKLKPKMLLYKAEIDLEKREKILKSMGIYFNKCRDLCDQIRNVISIDTQDIIFDQTMQMHVATQIPTLAGFLMATFGINYRFVKSIQWIESVFNLSMVISVVYMITKSYTGNRIKTQLRADLRAIDKAKWHLGNVLRIVDDARSWLVIYGKPDD